MPVLIALAPRGGRGRGRGRGRGKGGWGGGTRLGGGKGQGGPPPLRGGKGGMGRADPRSLLAQPARRPTGAKSYVGPQKASILDRPGPNGPSKCGTASA